MLCGANGPWKTGDYEFHLQPKEAQSLIAKVLETFKEKHGAPPKEFGIHGRTTFNEEEWKAFRKAAPKGTNVVGVRIKETHGECKLFRDGDYPVMRGTAVILNDRNALLWTNGFVPRLDTYIGPEPPNPLAITVLRAREDGTHIRTVLADIMGLTKIYNACNYDGLPVTIRFANKVGNVLTMGSARRGQTTAQVLRLGPSSAVEELLRWVKLSRGKPETWVQLPPKTMHLGVLDALLS